MDPAPEPPHIPRADADPASDLDGRVRRIEESQTFTARDVETLLERIVSLERTIRGVEHRLAAYERLLAQNQNPDSTEALPPESPDDRAE